MIKHKVHEKDEQHKPIRTLSAVLLMLLTLTMAGCISNNEELITPQTNVNSNANSTGEANAPLAVNATETPEPQEPPEKPTVTAAETPEPPEPTDSRSRSNVIFVTPTPEPTPTPMPEGTMLVPLDIPVTLIGANPPDPGDIEMNLFYTGVSIKGDIKYLPQEDVWISLYLYPPGEQGRSYCYMNEFSFEYPVDVDPTEIDQTVVHVSIAPVNEEY